MENRDAVRFRMLNVRPWYVTNNPGDGTRRVAGKEKQGQCRIADRELLPVDDVDPSPTPPMA